MHAHITNSRVLRTCVSSGFSSADSPYSDHVQTSSGLQSRPLIERVVGNPLLNSASAHSETEIESASTTLPSLARSPQEDVFTESRPLEHAKRTYRGDLAGVQQRVGTWGDIRSLPTLPTLSSDSSGSSISTLATPASPSPAPRHVRRRRRAHARMSLMFPLPTPGASATESRAAYRNSLDLSELARCRLWDERDNVLVLDKETEYVQR
ncbi:hypothetical protein EDB89DRAFT_1987218 [Lactarius sanguifluus]|nr:hypothetical protein EDB89DRAFT_1987218 [Lactarius sanguifluus]